MTQPSRPTSRFALLISFLMVAATLTGCGGGSGSGSANEGAFTLSSSALTFAAKTNSNPPPAQTITIKLTGPGTSIVGAAYRAGQTPASWLAITIDGSGDTYRLNVAVASLALQPGTYTATFAVGTTDTKGNVLKSQDVTVRLDVRQRISTTYNLYNYTVVSGDATPLTEHVTVATESGQQWTISSSVPWLQVPSGMRTGSTTIDIGIQAATLAPGEYNGNVTLAAVDDPADTTSVQFHAVVTAPQFTLSTNAITLGGDDGLSYAPQDVVVTLATGSGIHPLAISHSTDDGADWLTTSISGGSVGSGGTTVKIGADRSKVRGGTYTGRVQFDVNVNGVPNQALLVVTYNAEASRISVSSPGIALSSVAGRETLTRNVKVLSNLGRTDITWKAASDQPWLSVTAMGMTGANLKISADPTGLAPEHTYFANIVVTSSDSAVENSDSIRVGLYLSDSAPVDTLMDISASELATSPVEPLLFTHSGGRSVSVYNAYTGALIRSLSNLVGSAGTMFMSGDGRQLFVSDRANMAVVEVDPVSGSVIHTYPLGPYPSQAAGSYIRPDGRPFLLVDGWRAYDLTDGTIYQNPELSQVTSSGFVVGSPDGQFVQPYLQNAVRVRYSSVGGSPHLAVQTVPSILASYSNVRDVCFVPESSRIYATQSTYGGFPGFSLPTFQWMQSLAGRGYPNNVECTAGGLVVGGSSNYYETTDIWVYESASGAEIAHYGSRGPTVGERSLLDRQLLVSSDGVRMMALSASSCCGTSATPGDKLLLLTLPTP